MHFFVAKLLSTTVMTYTYVSYLRNLRLMIRLMLRTANKLQHATAARAHDARPHCRLMFPFYKTSIGFILPETRVLNYMKTAIVGLLVSLYLLLRNSFRKRGQGTGIPGIEDER